MASVTLRGLAKTYDPGGTQAVADLSLDVRDGEFFVLLGPSGCGKTTVLRCIAGLETPSAGEIRIGDRDVTQLSPGERDVAMVFQSHALYPHLSAWGNIAFGLEVRGVAAAEIARRVEQAAQRLGLTGALERRPGALSGGERQRVALARAIVREPRVFLYDEPLAHLDPTQRGELRAELLELHRALGVTVVYVTHDQVEAMTMGQRIAVLAAGRLRQVGSPAEVYGQPADVFVARFIGNPGMNVLTGRGRGAGRGAGGGAGGRRRARRGQGGGAGAGARAPAARRRKPPRPPRGGRRRAPGGGWGPNGTTSRRRRPPRRRGRWRTRGNGSTKTAS